MTWNSNGNGVGAVLKRIRQEAKEKANGKTIPSEHSQRLIFFPNDWQDRDNIA